MDNEARAKFTDLHGLRRGSIEDFKKSEASFAGRLSKLNAHGTAVSLHESLLAMMVLTGYFIDDSPGIQIFCS